MEKGTIHTRNARLVSQAQSGNREAFGQLYELYFPRIYYLALRQLGTDDNAQEVAQETFVRALLKLDDLRNPQAFQNWLYRIAHTVIMDASAQAATRRRLESEYDEMTLPEEQITYTDEEPEEEEFLSEKLLAAGLDHQFIQHLLNTLTDAQREAVLLRYFAGLAPRDISPILGISPATVSKRLHDARNALQLSAANMSRLDATQQRQPASASASAPAPASAQTPAEVPALAAAAVAGPVLSQLFEQDLRTSDVNKARELTTARLASALPTALMAGEGAGKAATSRAQFFLKDHARRAIKIKLAYGLVALVLLGAVGGYVLYRHNAQAAPTAQNPAGRVANTAPAQEASGEVTPAADNAAAPTNATTTTSATATVSSNATQQNPASTRPAAPTATPEPTPLPASGPTLAVAHPALTYPVGTTLSAARIIADAGASAHGAGTVTMTVSRLATVDPQQAGTSIVFIHASDAAGQTSSTQAVTITMKAAQQ